MSNSLIKRKSIIFADIDLKKELNQSSLNFYNVIEKAREKKIKNMNPYDR